MRISSTRVPGGKVFLSFARFSWPIPISLSPVRFSCISVLVSATERGWLFYLFQRSLRMEVFAVLIALCGKTAEVSRIQICINSAITQGSCRLFYFLGNSKDKPPSFFVLPVLILEGFLDACCNT